MLGRDPCRWHIGSPATARPLGKKPLTSSYVVEAAAKLLENCNLSFLGQASSQSSSISVAQTQPKGKEEPSAASVHTLTPYERQPAREKSGRGARARKQP